MTATATYPNLDRTNQQRLNALLEANNRRVAMSQLKHEIRSLPYRASRYRVAGLLRDPSETAGAMRFGVLLRSVRHIQGKRVMGLMFAAGVRSEDRHIRDLSERQRRIVADLLVEEAGRGRLCPHCGVEMSRSTFSKHVRVKHGS